MPGNHFFQPSWPSQPLQPLQFSQPSFDVPMIVLNSVVLGFELRLLVVDE
jgi:hypothetical protein